MNAKPKQQRFRDEIMNQRFGWATMLPNLYGVLLTFLFFNYVLPDPAENNSSNQLIESFALFATIAMTILLFVVADWLTGYFLRPVWGWYRHACRNEVEAPAPVAIQKAALNLPFVVALSTMAVWLLAGLTVGLTFGMGGSFDLAGFISRMIGTAGVAGPMATLLTLFAVEKLWHTEIPMFFGKDDPTQVPALRMSLRLRLIAMQFLGIMPILLLAIFALVAANSYAPGDPTGSQTALVTVQRLTWMLALAVVIVAVILARTLGTLLVWQIERLSQALRKVQDGYLNERATIYSNDEFGELAVHFNDMTDWLAKHDRELNTIHQISREIYSSIEIEKTLQNVLNQVQKIITYEGGEICLYNQSENALQVAAWARGEQVLTDTRGRLYRLGEGYTGWVGEQKRSLLVPDVEAEQKHQPVNRHAADNLPIQSYLGVPLVFMDKLVGTLELISVQKHAFTVHDQALLESIAPQAGMAIANAEQVQARERLLQAQIEMLRVEVDKNKQDSQVKEITGTEYFQGLHNRVAELRRKRQAKQ